MRKISILVLFLLLTTTGCFSKEELPLPGTPNVSEAQALEVAKNVYSLSNITKVEIRLLEVEEVANLNEEQKALTPIYYVIFGQLQNREATVYISTNERTHHFIVINEEK